MALRIESTEDNLHFFVRHEKFTEIYSWADGRLGYGINGDVRRCIHRETGIDFAVKTLIDSPRARREIVMQLKASENCEYIIKIVDIFMIEGSRQTQFLVVMERMHGGELFDRIEKRKGKPFTETEAVKYIWMIIKSVSHLHSMNMAHRDLKPENLLFTDESDNAILKLGDFGFAKIETDKGKSLETPCFSPFYVAPEILGTGKYNKACDIWSIGVIFYILLCGYPPFISSKIHKLTPRTTRRIKNGNIDFSDDVWKNISPLARSMVEKMLTVDEEKRITTKEILECPWLDELSNSNRLINTSHFDDQDSIDEFKMDFASAIDELRESDEEMEFPTDPEASAISKARNVPASSKSEIRNDTPTESNQK